MWAAIELYLGIIATCLPTLKPLMAKYFASGRNEDGETKDMQLPSFVVPRTIGTGGKRHPRNRADSLLSNGTYLESCPALPTPEPAMSRETISYFSFVRRSQSVVETQCSRSASVPNGIVLYEEEPPLPDGESSLRKTKSSIMRTTKVVTTTEEHDVEDWPLQNLSRESTLAGSCATLHRQRSDNSLPLR